MSWARQVLRPDVYRLPSLSSRIPGSARATAHGTATLAHSSRRSENGGIGLRNCHTRETSRQAEIAETLHLPRRHCHRSASAVNLTRQRASGHTNRGTRSDEMGVNDVSLPAGALD